MSSPNILFYSRKCQSCRNLMSLMGNEYLQYFQLICVDGRLKEMPRDLKAVPTLVVPSMGKTFIANDAFKYIQSQKFMKQQNQSQVYAQNQDNIAKQRNGPMGHNNMEMGGFSDEYAYQSQTIDKPQPKSFVNVGQENKNMIFTAPESKKIRESQQKNLMKQAERKRVEQDVDFNKHAKQSQIDMLIQAEYKKMQNKIMK